MIETPRLTIRRFAKTDAQDLFEYLSLPDTYLFEPGEPISLEEAHALASERSSGGSFFAVELKGANRMIGHLYFDKIEPCYFMTWELGYIFNPRYHNKGYCSEAAKAIVDYGFSVLLAHRIVAHCNPLNCASWKVLERIGMKREGHFKKMAFFRKDENGSPLWHDAYAYGLVE
ncbi:MAG TPA: GNAT family N-acetyltransferase [Spirochaetaceae bacterium]|jgi:RimJ/RimL family protein N-acetyltransferase|nr:GNAT family N-acetyltransferase [Spirochaetaceae bacterium]